MSFYLVVSLNVPFMSMKVAGRCNILRIGYQKYLLRNVTHSLIFLEVRRDQMGGDSPGSSLTLPHLFGEGCCAAVASSAGWGPGCYRFTGRGPALAGVRHCRLSPSRAGKGVIASYSVCTLQEAARPSYCVRTDTIKQLAVAPL